MRSKASFGGHPIHPMLVAFPIAFLYGSLVFDLAGLLGGWPAAYTTGAFMSLAAIGTGLIAAVPGLIDYLYVVPPNSSGKQWATWHMVVNVASLLLFGLGIAFRDWVSLAPSAATVALEAIGVGLITIGGWIGGILVYREQIGVDHRYAEAGKWREAEVDGKPGEAVAIDGADELEPGQMMLVHAPDRRIVVARTDEGYAAFEDRCTHRGGSLAGGVLAGETVCCPWHGSQYDVCTGQVCRGPAKEGIQTYEVEEEEGEVRLTLPGGEEGKAGKKEGAKAAKGR
jgi:nitrite reductase/ring-hydroxylating ferredoxin subunit/uncharacterized membrane protein